MQEEYKDKVKEKLGLIQEKMNLALNGNGLKEIEKIMKRFDKNQKLPSWFESLQKGKGLPNLDGKTVGSVVEKLLVCVIEKYILDSKIELSINPARGVDIPELSLGVKSPSTNYDTSEPFFSPYERLLGNEYDAIVLLTNYQTAKKKSPFVLQILQIRYLRGSEIADANLCVMAKSLREKYEDAIELKKAIKFLAYVNQSDWEASWILKLMREVIVNGEKLESFIDKIKKDFEEKNKKNEQNNRELLPNDALDRLCSLKKVIPSEHSIINAADNWVILTQKDNGRCPNDNEWRRFMNGKLDGKISMSFALQWRYYFKAIFKDAEEQ